MERVTGHRQAFQAQHFDGRRRFRFLHCFSVLIEHRPNFAINCARDEVIAYAERSVLDENRCDVAPAFIDFGFKHGAHGGQSRVRFQVLQVCDQQKNFEQQLEVLACFCRDLHGRRVAAPILRKQTFLGKLAFDALGIDTGFIDFVDSDDNGYLCSLGMRNRFLGLGHHSIIGGDNKHNDVCNLGAACAHQGERFVAGRIEKGDLAILRFHLISTDMLGNASGFLFGDPSLSNRIEQ